MKVTRFLLSVLFLGVTATAASAQGVVQLSWDTCTNAVINKQIAPGTASACLYASVLGHSQPHQAYEVNIELTSGAGGLADAWRFDAAGCQGSSFITIHHLAPSAVAKACPSFQGALSSIQIKDYSYDSATGKARGVMANTYPAGNTTQINPGVRYFLAAFCFDHTFSVTGAGTPGETCGGLENPVCITLTRANWLSPTGVLNEWNEGQNYVTANDPNNTLNCPGVVPAVDKTWGSLKAQYKR